MRAVRIIAWAVVAVLAVLAFLRTGATVLLGVAAAVVVLPLLTWALAVFAARTVQVRLDSPSSVAKGAPAQVSVEIANGAPVPVASARAQLTVRNLLTGERDVVDVSAALPPRSRVSVPVDVENERCGRVECSVDRVRLFDVLRLFSRGVSCQAERRFTVMPELRDAQLRDIYAASPLSDTTVFSPYVKGADLSEVFGLREYEPGDELKRVHWKLSEKIDQMIVRDASLPLDNALLLFWDKGVPESAGEVPGRADAMAEVVLALMEELARADVTFEVASNDIEASRCTRAFVTDENDIYEVIGQLISSPLLPAAESGLAEYVRFFGDLTCSRLVYVCCERPYNLESLLGSREALLFVCDGGADLVVRPPVSEVHFPPGAAAVALGMAGVV